MKRSTLLIATFAAGIVSMDEAGAQNIREIESRILSVEARLSLIEKRLNATSSGSSLKNDFTITPPDRQVAPPEIEIPQNTTYVIRDGDSLGGIARKFGLPRQALLDANNMADGQPIYIGETLVVPGAPVHKAKNPVGNSVVHTVRPGDTLTGISRKYRTSIAAIKQQNRLNSDVIGAGQQLVIPTSAGSSTSLFSGTPELPKNNTPVFQDPGTPAGASGKYQYDNPLLNSNETYGYYAVQRGDNLYALARDFFTTMKELQRLNKLGNSTVIHPGHEMVVPTSKYNDYHQNVAAN